MSAVGIEQVGYLDFAGGGQVGVDGNYAYVGHMACSHDTSMTG